MASEMREIPNKPPSSAQSAGALLSMSPGHVTGSPRNSVANAVDDIHTEVDALSIGDDKLFSLLRSSTKSKSTLASIDRYQMNGHSRGQAVIINNENFHWTTGMNKRTGTDVDGWNLKHTFKKLGFDVSLHKDVTCVQMLEVIRFMAQDDHTGSDCFMCAISSHGDDGCVYGTDGTIKIKAIVNQFRGDVCPTLAGKPKVFLFQACRGTQREVPVPPATDVVDGAVEKNGKAEHIVTLDAAPVPTLPSGSDFLFCYSVVEGYYSHRDTLYGSWYIQDFTAVINDLILKKGSQPVDFLDVLTVVNRRVASRRVERSLSHSSLGKKQMSCFLSMLTKKLYLTRK